MVKIFPAATVVLVRDSGQGLETLLLRRSTEVSFAGGSWVFPGGRIDKADYGEQLDDIELAARYAAVRETQEEAGLRINRASLQYLSHWTTPPHYPKRFATWFFISDITDISTSIKVDGSEIVEYRWYSPQQALQEQRGKQIELMPPAFVTLTELADYSSAQEAINFYTQRSVPEFKPVFTKTESGIVMLYHGDAGYVLADPYAEGARHRLWLLDEAWRYEKSDYSV